MDPVVLGNQIYRNTMSLFLPHIDVDQEEQDEKEEDTSSRVE
jgi:hypothetical protein